MHFIVAPVAKARYQILAWFYSFQILYEVSPRNPTHSAPAQDPVDKHIQLRFQGRPSAEKRNTPKMLYSNNHRIRENFQGYHHA
jgi:hypothetical protein